MIWRVVPLLFLSLYTAPYITLVGRYGLAFYLDEYVVWVFQYTIAQALASSALSILVGILLIPTFVKYPFLKPVVLIPFFAPAISTVDALIRVHGDLMYGPWGIVVAHFVYYAPYAALLIESNLRSIPNDLFETMYIYKVRFFTKIKIYLYELKPSLYYSFYTIFIFSFLSFSTPLLLGGRYPTLELLVYIYATAFAGAELLSTILTLMLASSLLIAIPLFKLPQLPPAAPSFIQPRFSKFYTAVSLTVAGYFIYVSLSIFTPLAAPRGINEMTQPFLNSVAVALVASATSLGVVLLFIISHAAGSKTPLAVYFITLSLSKSLFALGFFQLAQPLYGTLAILALAHLLAITPLAYSIVKPSWDKLRLDTKESCVLYLKPHRCVYRVVSEALGPTFIQTWLFSLASSLSETTLALILTTGGATTLSAEIVRLLSSRAPDLIERGHFYSAMLAVIVLLTLAMSKLIKPRPYSY
ncbi:MAG: iron ABC transporter permease [Pyrobaculum sp.]